MFRIKVVNLIYVLLVVFLSISLKAQPSCHTKDLSQSKGLVNRVATNQGNSGWCYAYSYADIFSQRLGEAVSPFDIAFRVNDDTKKTYDRLANADWKGGGTNDVQKVLQQEPWLCSEKNYKEIDPDYLAHLYLSDSGKFDALKRSPCESKGFVNQFFKNIEDLSEIVETTRNSSDSFEFFRKLNEKNCVPKISFPFKIVNQNHRSGWDDYEAHKQTLSYVQKVLDSDKIISASIDLHTFFRLGAPFFERQKAAFLGGHQATITGVERREGRCYYKIRDSFISLNSCQYLGKKGVNCLGDGSYEVDEDIFDFR